ncbi:Gfo/Idh/MocA family oxidoreductase, partial [Salmonella enterica subsp. enterica serovar Virginia]|nr:Gfo/Idh/MocA family oxidoreductase [Salmonella enterica subsp. enterica serovar Virginia]
DNTIEISVTPNRADCLGIIGVARDVAVLNKEPLQEPEMAPVTAVYSRSLEQAQSFANDYPVEHLFTSLEAMAQSDAIEAVYIA